MSLPSDPRLHGLDDCDCCAGIGAHTPEPIANRPGLPAIRYRAGTHSTFLASLLAGLSDPSRPALGRLTTREPDDPTIALLDGVATMADVLAFYQERIANESYLRTATERRSVLELARAIGYELAPGVAAGTVLAFTVEDAPGAPPIAPVDAGTRVQSVPGPGERPQVFETVEPVEARAVWNTLRPLGRRAWAPVFGDRALTVAGLATGLAIGDMILIVGAERAADPGDERWDVRRLTRVAPDPEREVTVVEWEDGLGTGWPRHVDPAATQVEVLALRRTAALFGHNAPPWDTQSDDVRGRYFDEAFGTQPPPNTTADTLHEWPKLTIRDIAGEDDVVHLDAHYADMVADSWVVLSRSPGPGLPPYAELYRVTAASESARQGFALATPTTRLELSGEGLIDRFGSRVRSTVAFGQSELLATAPVAIPDPVERDTIELESVVADALPAGRRLVVRGVLAAGIPGGPPAGERHAEVAVVESSSTGIVHGTQVTVLTLEEDLAGSYVRDTVTILGNVAEATHGEGVGEVLGGGDATAAFQRFALRDGPLTHVGADTPQGRESTLELWVDDVRWRRVDAFYEHGPRERIYTERRDDDGTTSLHTGDGRTGARLPTGQGNVRAIYRKGIGREANLDHGSLSLLMTRPLGVRGVANPIPATGGADPETMDGGRERAPLTVLTMGRIVSLRDYEDFATSFAGIAKARAVWLWGTHGRVVHVTVAGPDGDVVPEGGPVRARLESAMELAGDPHVPVLIETFRPVPFHVLVMVGAHPDHNPARVVEAVGRALGERFSFAARRLGQTVALSEVVACIHAVRGVEWAEAGFDPEPTPPDRLVAQAPRTGDPAEGARGAQLLTIEVRRGDLGLAP